MRRVITLAFVAVVGLGLPTATRAQDVPPARLAEARQLFEAGMRLAGDERWAEALDSLRRARAIAARPSTVLNVALALFHLGRARESLATLDALAAMPGLTGQDRTDATSLRTLVTGLLAELALTVTPATADVEVDGQRQAGSGAVRRIALDPGDHVVRVSAPGFAAERYQLTARAASHAARSIELHASGSTLAIESEVTTARITVDGHEVGVGSTTADVTPGVHHVRVTAPDHEPFERDVTVGAGEHLELQATPSAHHDDGGILASPIFWTIVAIVAAAGIATAIGIVAGTHDEPPYGGTTGVILSLDAR